MNMVFICIRSVMGPLRPVKDRDRVCEQKS
jgi:hypothetical protein